MKKQHKRLKRLQQRNAHIHMQLEKEEAL